ncbi:MAG: sigma-70 family RNA polymerase sigma factor [Rickettsiales bacterium]
MSTLTDKYATQAALFRSGLEGNQVDYCRFLASITPILKRMIGKRLNPSEVDDVVQEILISIHKARHTYDGMRPMMPWIASIAKFRLTDHLRKHYTARRDKTVDISELENILADVTEEASDRESIDELLKDVPEQHQRILTLMHVEGYTAKEVGAQLNINESAVKVAAHRAIKKIRKKFAA